MSFTPGKPVKAKKIKGSLIAAFPGANPPVVWKFDLEKNHSFTMALQGEDGDWELGVTSPRGEFYPVAHFVAREDADDAFARTQNAMLKREHNFWRVLGPICLGLIILFILLSFIESLFRHAIPKGALTAGSPITSSSGTSGYSPSLGASMGSTVVMPEILPRVEVKEGVPQQADQVLTPPQ